MTVPNSGCNIIIIGFSATGKSRVAPAVAAALGWEHFDTDAEVCRIAGKSADDIFKQDGETGFRAIEKRVLQAAALKRNTVICTGGGAVVSPDNRELMSRAGMVVLLEAKPETVLRRLQADVAHSGDATYPFHPLKRDRASRGQQRIRRRRLTVPADNLARKRLCFRSSGWRYWRRIHCERGTDAGKRGGYCYSGYPIR